MAGQVPLEESNVALINSDLAKNVRQAAAQYEAEWEGAGSAVGIQIWRAENLGIRRWPKTEYGHFFDGDSYIVLHTYKQAGGDKLLHNVHFWLGQNTSQDEAGVVAYKTVELDDLLSGLPVQYREVQGHETPEFLALFHPGMMILSGGIASGFNKVEPASYKPRLMQVKGKRNAVKVTEVALTRDSLNDGDVFILDKGLQLFQWNGTSAGIFEKRQATDVVNAIKNERNGRPTSQVLDGDEDCPEFWEALGGKGAVKSAEEGGPDEAKATGVKKLLKLSDASGSLVLTEVAFSRSNLDSNDVFLLDDNGQRIFVWIGNGASIEERGKAFIYANDYISKNRLPTYTPVQRVVEGNTSPSFDASF